jgi:hypothetical protein
MKSFLNSPLVSLPAPAGGSSPWQDPATPSEQSSSAINNMNDLNAWEHALKRINSGMQGITTILKDFTYIYILTFTYLHLQTYIYKLTFTNLHIHNYI